MNPELQIRNKTEAAQVVSALIQFERSLRRLNNALGIGPWSVLAVRIQACRRKLQEDAGLVRQ